MKHALIVALLAVPFAHAADSARKPSSSASFSDGTKIETVWSGYGNASVMQIKDPQGRVCYGIVGENSNGTLSCSK